MSDTKKVRMNMEKQSGHLSQSAPQLKSRALSQRPSMYEVTLLNDDATPMDFVVMLLQRHFNKTRSDAVDLVQEIHTNGQGICGIYTRDVAETKVSHVIHQAREQQHPLKCVMQRMTTRD